MSLKLEVAVENLNFNPKYIVLVDISLFNYTGLNIYVAIIYFVR